MIDEKKVTDVLARELKDVLQQSFIELQVLYDDHMNLLARPNVSRSGRLYFKAKNNTSQLRRLRGNLTRALSPRGEGNVSKIIDTKNGVAIESGVIDEVIPYAKFHELGLGQQKRPFLLPAIIEYNEKILPALVQDAIVKTFNQL